jgi:hypothetical protein
VWGQYTCARSFERYNCLLSCSWTSMFCYLKPSGKNEKVWLPFSCIWLLCVKVIDLHE